MANEWAFYWPNSSQIFVLWYTDENETVKRRRATLCQAQLKRPGPRELNVCCKCAKTTTRIKFFIFYISIDLHPLYPLHFVFTSTYKYIHYIHILPDSSILYCTLLLEKYACIPLTSLSSVFFPIRLPTSLPSVFILFPIRVPTSHSFVVHFRFWFPHPFLLFFYFRFGFPHPVPLFFTSDSGSHVPSFCFFTFDSGSHIPFICFFTSDTDFHNPFLCIFTSDSGSHIPSFWFLLPTRVSTSLSSVFFTSDLNSHSSSLTRFFSIFLSFSFFSYYYLGCIGVRL